MRTLALILLVFVQSATSRSEPHSLVPYQYLYPLPNSTGVHAETNIIVRFDTEAIAPRTLKSGLVRVTGSTSGMHEGTLVLSDDRRTIVFRPDRKFAEGETVEVSILPGISTATNVVLPSWLFKFTISPSRSSSRAFPQGHTASSRLIPPSVSPAGKPLPHSTRVQESLTLPEDFPPIRILKNGTPEGNPLFLGSFAWGPDTSSPYLMILNRDGRPLFYRRAEGWDFTVQPNGSLTYYDESLGYFVALDSSYHIVDMYACGNGYATNEHELRVLPNGHALLMSYDRRIVPMDTLVAGGDTAAYVTGLVIQELDLEKNVVFEWRSWDHFSITDATQEDLTAQSIDYVHGNSIEIDPDENLLISCRNMDEITKIDRTTGEILWRWGGKHNDFTFINDPIGFDHQHAARRLSNGNILFFDNGTYREYSRAVEYSLDEQQKTATLVWEYRHSPDILGWALGCAQRLPNGNTLIGWGSANPTVTEVTQQGVVAYELDMREIIYTYRIYSLPWRTTAFVPSVDSLTFPPCAVGDSTSSTLTITNPTDYEISLTTLRTASSFFTVPTEPPITLAAHESAVVHLVYMPQKPGTTLDTLEIGSVDSTQGIFQYVSLKGSSPVPELLAFPSTLNFGEVGIGDTARARVTLTASSSKTITVDSILTTTRWFSVDRVHLVVTNRDSATVSFTSNTAGVFSDTLSIWSDAEMQRTRIPLAGSCPARTFSVSLDSLDFGSVPRGDSLTRRIILRNPSASRLTLSSLTVYGSPYKVRTATPVTVKGKDTLAIDVQFAPSAYGLFRDTLRLDSDGGAKTVSMRGLSIDPSVSADDKRPSLPTEFSLSQNYPNPFNPTTTLVFAIPWRSRVIITIFDAVGREVGTVVNDNLEAGYYRTLWKPDRIATGVYVCRMSATPLREDHGPAFVRAQKLLLLR
jgi:hypothetical protein